ncbi:hypothetical protein A2U01_0094257, partial [Trifolium medium]|nr:hypothetical protein [Trifolium medium]
GGEFTVASMDRNTYKVIGGIGEGEPPRCTASVAVAER